MEKTNNKSNLLQFTLFITFLSIIFFIVIDNDISKIYKIIILLFLELSLIILVIKECEKVLNKINSLFKLNIDRTLILYIFFVFFVSFIPIITLSFLFPFNVWINIVAIGIIGVFLAYKLMSENPTYRLYEILPENFKKRLNFYLPIWQSKELDEFVGTDLLELYLDANRLFSTIRESETIFSDYSFIVFPLAKVYEGVLKKILVQVNLIKEGELLENPDISINAYFNPIGNEKIKNVLRDKTRDKAIPFVIYSTYQECRNQILHYDPYRDNRLKTIEDAEYYQRRIIDAIIKAFNTFKKT